MFDFMTHNDIYLSVSLPICPSVYHLSVKFLPLPPPYIILSNINIFWLNKIYILYLKFFLCV